MRALVISRSFQKRLRIFLKRYPQLKPKLEKLLHLLQDNPYQVSLGTHQLKGGLKEFHACKIDYDYRLVFQITDDEICLLNIGSHDEVY